MPGASAVEWRRAQTGDHGSFEWVTFSDADDNIDVDRAWISVQGGFLLLAVTSRQRDRCWPSPEHTLDRLVPASVAPLRPREGGKRKMPS